MNEDEDLRLQKLASDAAKHLNKSDTNLQLARQIVKFANSLPLDGFISACRAFGRFDDDFLRETYTEWKLVKIKSESSRLEKNNAAPVVKNETAPLKNKSTGKGLFKKRTVFRQYEDQDEDIVKPDVVPSGKVNGDDGTTAVTVKRENSPLAKIKTEASSEKHPGLSEAAKRKLEAIRAERKEKEREKLDNGMLLLGSSTSLDSLTSDVRDVKRRPSELDSPPSRTRPRRRSPSPLPMEEPFEYDAETSAAQDRDWYLQEEYGYAAGEDFHNPFYDGSNDDAQLETKVQKRISSYAAQKQRDRDMWESNRLQTSGMGGGVSADADFDEEEDRVHLFVHSLTPPFLSGQQIFSRLKDPVSAVRDPQSDMAVFAKKGSALVRERRMRREQQKHARDATNIAGTALGNVLGVTEEEDDDNAAGAPSRYSDTAQKEENDNAAGQSDFSRKKTLREQRQFLPAFAVRRDLLNIIRDNQVVVVIGETGSGKTTQLTQFLYEDGYASRGMIGCTQPRRVAAMSVAKRVSEEMDVRLGDEVGYSIRFEDYTSEKTAIKYLTDGILLRESLADPNLEKYSCIIMDEAHERALNTDVLMGLLKKVLARRLDLKLIVTSATLNATRFSEFYGGAPQFTIPGRTFPVEILHHQTPVEDYVDAAVKQVLTIHLTSGPGDILVFMTGQEDIETTCEVLAERLQLLDSPDPLLILPIYSQMPSDLQAKIFDPAPKGSRKVIVATNIAETSLTVDGIVYVVDAGYSKVKVYNPKMGMDALQITPISQANAGQRAGRAGRTGKGVAYRLYTERAEREELYPQAIPEIQRTNLANTLLLLKSLGVDNMLEFDFMDPPPTETITASLYDLWALGALDNLGRLTPAGQKMAQLPMEPSLSKLLITSVEHACSEEMLTIVSMLSVPTVFYRPKERQEESDAAREKFFVPESDHLTLLHVYNQWRNNRMSDAWCARHFLHAKALRRAREVRDQLESILTTSQRLPIRSSGGDWDVIRKCICTAYFAQAARVKGLGEYINLRTNVTMQLHPTSSLYGLGYLPDYVVYHELILTSKQYMSTVTAVDPLWLADFGGVFYSVKLRGYSARDKRATENEYSKRMELEAEIEEDRKRYEKMLEDQKDRERRRNKKPVITPKPKFRTARRGF